MCLRATAATRCRSKESYMLPQHRRHFIRNKRPKIAEKNFYASAMNAFDRLIVYHGYSADVLHTLLHRLLRTEKDTEAVWYYFIHLARASAADDVVLWRQYDPRKHVSANVVDLSRDQINSLGILAHNDLSVVDELFFSYSPPDYDELIGVTADRLPIVSFLMEIYQDSKGHGWFKAWNERLRREQLNGLGKKRVRGCRRPTQGEDHRQAQQRMIQAFA